MDRATAADAQWLAMQMPRAIRTSIDWGSIDRVASGRGAHAGLETLYGQPMTKELNDLARLLRPTSPHSPAFPGAGHEQEEGSPTYMLLNLLGLLPGSNSGVDRPQAFAMPRLPVSPLNLSDQSGTSMMSDRTGDRVGELAQWTTLLQQQTRQRLEDGRGLHADGPDSTHHGHFQESDAATGHGGYGLHDDHHHGMVEFSSDGRGDGRGGPSPLHPEVHLSSRSERHSKHRSGSQQSLRPPSKRVKSEPSLSVHAGGVTKPKAATKAALSSHSDADMLGAWSEDSKSALMEMVAKYKPRGSKDWQLIAEALGRPQGASSAERMFRSLTNPDYQRPANKHGRRLNPRKGIPMHVMATYALLRLPDREGNLSEMASKIEENKFFCKHLDWTPRPGTKTYPRWKDALVGCFKPGRYPHLKKTNRKRESLTVYTLIEELIPEKSRLKPSMIAEADPTELPADLDRMNPLMPMKSPPRRAKMSQDTIPPITTGQQKDDSHHSPEEKLDDAASLGHAHSLLHEVKADGAQAMNSLMPGLSLLPGNSLLGRVDSQVLNDMPSDLLHLLQGHLSETRNLQA